MELEINQNLTNKNEISNQITNEVTNELSIRDIDVEKEQTSFFETTIGKVVNTGLDMALRAILPNVIEDEVIGIKNIIFTEGLQSGLKTAVDSAINLGKSAMGIFTGKFDTVSQAYTAIKSGGIIDTTSRMIDNAVKSAKENGLIKNTTANLIKKGKNAIKDCISDEIEQNFMEQVDGAEKLGKYINNWNNCLSQGDLTRNEKRIWKNKN